MFEIQQNQKELLQYQIASLINTMRNKMLKEAVLLIISSVIIMTILKLDELTFGYQRHTQFLHLQISNITYFLLSTQFPDKEFDPIYLGI